MGGDGKKILKGKFGASVKLAEPSKNRYIFDKWKPALPETFPANNSNIPHVAIWNDIYVCITVKGDERIVERYVNVSNSIPKTWGDVKSKITSETELKAGWSGNYGVYDWRLNDEMGEEIADNTPLTDSMVVYARSNFNRFKIINNIIHGIYGSEKPRGRIIIPKFVHDIYHDAFKNCTELKNVDFADCTELKEIEGFSHCTSLKNIDLSSCINLQSINGFDECTALENVNITGCGELKSIGGFYGCKSLKNIDLSSCTNLQRINGFNGCTTLENVNFTGCGELKEIGGFSGCKSLKSVDLSPCANLQSINMYGFRDCTALENVNFTGCGELKKIGGFSGCKSLKSVDLSPCIKLKTIDSAFNNCVALENVNFTGCTELKSIEGDFKRPSFMNCKNLKKLDLSSCHKLYQLWLNGVGITSIEDIKFSPNCKLNSLLILDTDITSIDLSPFDKLEALNLRGTNIKTIDLSSLSRLRSLDLSETDIKSIDLSKCAKLESVGLKNCKKITFIDLSNNEEIAFIHFYGSINAIIKLPSKYSYMLSIPESAFGKDESTWCKEVLVPNREIHREVLNSGYPSSRIRECY